MNEMNREEIKLRREKCTARAIEVLRGVDVSFQEITALADQLKKDNAIGYARKLLLMARQMPEASETAKLKLKLAQNHALCTYKDPDWPAEQRFKRALEILQEADDLKTTKNQETLGQAGAINKRRWEMEGQRQLLERALYYYRRGYEQGIENDYGYTAINTAFVLDLLAEQEENEAKFAGTSSTIAATRRAEAQKIREEIKTKLWNISERQGNEWLNQEWWFPVTLAEACLGLRDYDSAQKWLADAKALADQGKVAEWEYETTARQLAQIASLHRDEHGKISQRVKAVLQEFLGQDVDAVESIFRGKVGLALSGGGFRASLFHIGVLAKLAECDALRHIETISCVSGGSIIGAHYYLELRHLLQQKEEKGEKGIKQQDYIDLVQRVSRDFLAGVQRNVRTRVAASLLTNLKMIFLPNYSRTQRVGEVYEEEIYSRIADRDPSQKNEPRWIDDLRINPKGEPARFEPKYDNWRRKHKVPMLVLNATTLNTGHNWQFTASWMGEPPTSINTDVDGNYRLRRMYYDKAPEKHQKIRLGHAVAASSGVPGIFEPLVLADLYEQPETKEKITVRLVDGGVHDNQGGAALLAQGCNVLLISDASGQMDVEDDPGSSPLGVLVRSDSVLQARVREAQYRELNARKRATLLQGLMFIHLKLGLDVEPKDWINCPDPYAAGVDARDEAAERHKPLTRYGINKQIQRQLSAVRTDLDSFSDMEAYSLMASGYKMAAYRLPQDVPALLADPLSKPPEWEFLNYNKLLESPDRDAPLRKLLSVSSRLAFKVWQQAHWLKVTAILLGIVAAVALVWTYSSWAQITLLTCGSLATIVFFIVLGKIVGPTLVKGLNYRKTLQEVAIGLGMSVLGWLAAGAHLHVFDRMFLRLGSASRFPKDLRKE